MAKIADVTHGHDQVEIEGQGAYESLQSEADVRPMGMVN